MKSDKLPQEKSLEATLVEDYKFENKSSESGVQTVTRYLQPSPHHCLRLQLLKATIAVAGMAHNNFRVNCSESSCIVVNVGARL